ncbi:MAG TPA: undecaprenyldiphospho-muramoylpentapeptide beta-N-acetylglucosaminyltransferase [Candidatus Binataceae bacterium]|nr:undecaprenyldiphospho-muramoylpentapeptide beta-N-acetylglucosaminyltransferase [Candidatus Binataceae bacterium]
MRVIIAGGGTGGHLFPAVAVGEEIVRQRPASEVLYVGASNGFEARWMPGRGYRFELLAVHGIRGHGAAARMRALAEFVRAARLARAIVARMRPHLVVCVGGYASAPVGAAAALARVPIVMLEQNVMPGLSNRILQRFARRICISFADSLVYFPPAKVELTGNPVRYRARTDRTPIEARPAQILVLGASTGAHRLNIGVVGAFKIWGKGVIKLKVTHQTGEADVELVRQAYGELPLNAEVVPFIDDVPAALAAADLVVGRSGGGTVTDIALAARAAIFVPYPFHRDMQQLHNARVIEKLGGAIIVADDSHIAENLAREMKSLLGDPARLVAMGVRANAAAYPDAAARVARVCFDSARVEN